MARVTQWRTAKRKLDNALYHEKVERLYDIHAPWRSVIREGLDACFTLRSHLVPDVDEDIRGPSPARGRISSVRYKRIYGIEFMGRMTEEFHTWGDVHRYCMFYMQYAAAIERWELEVSSVGFVDLNVYQRSDKWKEHVGEVFGVPKVLRYFHTCTDCVPLIKYREWDVYLCNSAAEHVNRHTDRSTFLVFRPSPNPEQMLYYDVDIHTAHSALVGMSESHTGIQQNERAYKFAHMYLFHNRDNIPLIKSRWTDEMIEPVVAGMRNAQEQWRARRGVRQHRAERINVRDLGDIRVDPGRDEGPTVMRWEGTMGALLDNPNVGGLNIADVQDIQRRTFEYRPNPLFRPLAEDDPEDVNG